MTFENSGSLIFNFEFWNPFNESSTLRSVGKLVRWWTAGHDCHVQFGTRQATCLFSPSTLFRRPTDDDGAVLNAFIATRSKVGQLSGFFSFHSSRLDDDGQFGSLSTTQNSGTCRCWNRRRAGHQRQVIGESTGSRSREIPFWKINIFDVEFVGFVGFTTDVGFNLPKS